MSALKSVFAILILTAVAAIATNPRDGATTTRDNQALLRFVLQQNPLGQTEPCADIGTQV